MIVVLAFLSAFVFGTGVVLQQHAARTVPDEHAAKPALLIRLVRQPLWLLGMGADIIGFALQTAALRRGSLVVVQPIITSSLVFTLWMLALMTRERITTRQWIAVGLTVAGLVVFLVGAAPADSSGASANTSAWLLCTAAVLAVALVGVGVGLRSSGMVRATSFAVAAAVGDAFMATLAKAFANSLGHGLLHVFATWTPYAVVGGGITALLLTGTAYQAGHPTVSLPVITVGDPLFSSLIGVTLFAEALRFDGAHGAALVVALITLTCGLVLLGRDDRVATEVGGQAEPTPAPSNTSMMPAQ